MPMIGQAVFTAGTKLTTTLTFSEAMTVALSSIPGQAAALLAVNLSLSGIQQMMAPDPAVDQDSPTNYLFSGGASNSVEGDPIPILYGELRVPGRPISVDIRQGGNGSAAGSTIQDFINNTTTDSANNTNITQTQTQEK